MTTQWTSIAPEEALHHRLYGVKNWLAVFAFGVLYGLLRELAEINAAAVKAGLSLSAFFGLDHPAVTFAKLALGIETLGVLAIYWAMFTKHPKFRMIASSVLIATWPLIAIVGASTPFHGLGGGLALSFLPWAIGCAVWVTYLQRSVRVRVTYEHMVRVEHVAQSSGSPGTGHSLAHRSRPSTAGASTLPNTGGTLPRASRTIRQAPVAIAGAIVVAAVALAILFWPREPRTFEDCVLEKMKGQNPSLLSVANRACAGLPRARMSQSIPAPSRESDANSDSPATRSDGSIDWSQFTPVDKPSPTAPSPGRPTAK